MQFVYILVNEHVPNLVKFGFSTRDPHDRAAELSAPTGVPGSWKVYHYWEVEDGYAVEQSIFRKLSAHRLERQEFFRFTAGEAVRIIARELEIVGTNPTEKARAEEEAKRSDLVRRVAEWDAQEKLKAPRRRELEERRERILRAIEVQQQPVRDGYSNRDRGIHIYLLIWGFAFGCAGSPADGFKAFQTGIISMAVVGLIMFLLSVFMGDASNKNPRLDGELAAIEAKVLAENGCRSRQDLEIPIELRKRDF